jgi:uncharacterized protein DUF4430
MEGSSHEAGRAAVRRLAMAGLVALAVAGLGGCGDSAEPSGPTVTQRVTREFGRELLAAEENAPLAGHDTVLRLLREYEDVKTSSGGSAVSSIDGMKADWEQESENDDESTWALNVNGIEADEEPGKYKLYPGDLVQWDLRYWYVTLDVRATVGAFPQTFTRGVFGKRFPVTVECAQPSATPCARVKGALRDAGVATDGSLPAGGRPQRGQPQRARVLVGPWRYWRGRAWPKRIDAGARYSGVFARFSPDAGELRLLDWYAHRSRTEGSGTGLVAAMRPTEEDLLWLVTGVDDLGVERAANALNSHDLRDAFAVAVTEAGVEKLPLTPR